MKKSYISLICMILCASAFAGESKTEKLPTISEEVEISKFVEATECYVVFLLEGTGESMLAAKEIFDKKQKAFSEKIKKDFPQATEEILSVNFGTRDFSNYRAMENPFSPTVAKVLIVVIPPDENMALRLLDSGVKSGLIPFCGASRDGTFGAVFFGLKDPEKEINNLYPQGTRKLLFQAEKLVNELGRKIVRMEDISRFSMRENPYELRFKDIKVILPGEFCSTEKNRIKISLALRATFLVQEKKSDK